MTNHQARDSPNDTQRKEPKSDVRDDCHCIPGSTTGKGLKRSSCRKPPDGTARLYEPCKQLRDRPWNMPRKPRYSVGDSTNADCRDDKRSEYPGDSTTHGVARRHCQSIFVRARSCEAWRFRERGCRQSRRLTRDYFRTNSRTSSLPRTSRIEPLSANALSCVDILPITFVASASPSSMRSSAAMFA